MPRIGVSITKSVAFRGATQEFSNVYYYEVDSTPANTDAATLIDNLVTLEKTFHSTSVTFVRGRCWLETGNKLTSEMIEQHNLTGTGARSTVASFDPERAFLFRIRAGIDSRGNPVYLRKWYHSVGNFSSLNTVTASQLSQGTSFSTLERNNLVTAMTDISDANNSAGNPKLCSKAGRQPDLLALWDAHRFLEHHQLGDQWRAQ